MKNPNTIEAELDAIRDKIYEEINTPRGKPPGMLVLSWYGLYVWFHTCTPQGWRCFNRGKPRGMNPHLRIKDITPEEETAYFQRETADVIEQYGLRLVKPAVALNTRG